MVLFYAIMMLRLTLPRPFALLMILGIWVVRVGGVSLAALEHYSSGLPVLQTANCKPQTARLRASSENGRAGCLSLPAACNHQPIDGVSVRWSTLKMRFIEWGL